MSLAAKPITVAVLLALFSQTALSADTTKSELSKKVNETESDEIERITLDSLLVTGRAGLDQINNTATKMNISVRDTGRSIAVLDERALREMNVTELDQVLDYMPGFSASDSSYGSLTIRGLETDYNNILIDGLRTLQGANDGDGGRTGSILPNTYNLESAAFLRGQDGLLYGSGIGGGMINLTTKKPQEEASTSIGAIGTSYLASDVGNFERNRISYTVDSTGPLSDNVLYRVIALSTPSGDYFQNGLSINEKLADLSLTFLLGNNTRLTPRIEYAQREVDGLGTISTVLDSSKIDPTNEYGTPYDRSVYYGSSQDYNNNKTINVDLTLAHKFSEEWELNSRVRYSKTDAKQLSLGIDSNLLDSYVINRRWRAFQNNDAYKMLDIGVQGRFSTGSIEHHLLVGGSYRDFSTDYGGAYQSSSATEKNIIDPLDSATQVVGAIPDDVLNFDITPKAVEDINVYLKDRITIGKLTLNPGLSYIKQEQVRSRSSRLTYLDVYDGNTNKLLWDFGAIYALNDDLNIFTTYSYAYDPINVRYIAQYGYETNEVGTDDYVPVEGRNYEIGVKGDFFGKRLTTSITAFRLDRENKTSFDCSYEVAQSCLLTQGRGKNFTSKGLEADLTYRVNNQWSGSFSYAYTRANFTKGNDEGIQTDNTPKHSATMWNRYRLDGSLSDIKLALGVRYESERLYGSDNVVPSYIEADFGIYYDQPIWEMSLLLKNVFDKNRAKTGSDYLLVTPNEPRALTFNIKRHF